MPNKNYIKKGIIIAICRKCGSEYEKQSNGQKDCKDCISPGYQRKDSGTKEERKKEYYRLWYLKNKTKIAEYHKKHWKEYSLKNKDKIKEIHKKYAIQNKEKILTKSREYYYNHKEGESLRSKKYNLLHKEQRATRQKKYRELNKDKLNNYNKTYSKTTEGKLAISRRDSKRYRNLGFNPLNVYFKGSDGHHIGKECVVYIPQELHRGIRHSLLKNRNMEAINAAALDYLFTSATI